MSHNGPQLKETIKSVATKGLYCGPQLWTLLLNLYCNSCLFGYNRNTILQKVHNYGPFGIRRLRGEKWIPLETNIFTS